MAQVTPKKWILVQAVWCFVGPVFFLASFLEQPDVSGSGSDSIGITILDENFVVRCLQTKGRVCCGSLVLLLVVVVVVVVIVVVVMLMLMLYYYRSLSTSNTGTLVHRKKHPPCIRRWFSLQKRLNDLRLELLSEEGRSQVGKDGWRLVGIGDIWADIVLQGMIYDRSIQVSLHDCFFFPVLVTYICSDFHPDGLSSRPQTINYVLHSWCIWYSPSETD